jgi:hypothetical protein
MVLAYFKNTSSIVVAVVPKLEIPRLSALPSISNKDIYVHFDVIS